MIVKVGEEIPMSKQDYYDLLAKQRDTKERAAYEAGLRDGWNLGNECFPSIDIEQHWQQYRCRDETGFRATPGNRERTI